MPVAGVHLMPTLAAIGGPHPSAVAVLDDDGALAGLRLADDDGDIAGSIPPGTDAVCVDAPLAVPDARGRRDLEQVLAWCDVPAFPVSRERLHRVHGGARGPVLRRRLEARAGRVLEAMPDLVLRELLWEQEHPCGAPPMDLRDYRERWISVRAPAYRRGGRGPGLMRAHAIVAATIDLRGWTPSMAGGEEGAIGDAARLDALLCAYAARRLADDADAIVLGTAERGALAVPADANLRARIALNLARLRAEGAVRI